MPVAVCFNVGTSIGSKLKPISKMETAEIDYLCNGYSVAFKLIFTSENGKKSVYISPFVFESTEDAYYGAINELSN